MDKYELMAEALKEARIAYAEDEVPIGCIIAKDGEIIARAHNTKVQKRNTLNHAEINAINIASEYLDLWYLDECELYEIKLVPFKLKYADYRFIISDIEDEMNVNEYDGIVEQLYCSDFAF